MREADSASNSILPRFLYLPIIVPPGKKGWRLGAGKSIYTNSEFISILFSRQEVLIDRRIKLSKDPSMKLQQKILVLSTFLKTYMHMLQK
ncbi:uncharacterized protein [Engystomops pustulosus]|uniref:uncharacterized protein isoform X4 n=1 Tax=Engystomops pustulosus TaxID=76066 RepID=UPI003AFB7C31